MDNYSFFTHSKPPTPYSPPFSPSFSDQDLSAWLGEKNLPEEINFDVDELDFEFNNNFESTTSGGIDSAPILNIRLQAKELATNCAGLGLKGVTNTSILHDGAPTPSVPEVPKV